VKQDCAPLDELPSTLGMSRSFSNIPMLEAHNRAEKGVMLPLQKLLFDVMHKMMFLRKHRYTEVTRSHPYGVIDFSNTPKFSLTLLVSRALNL